jgi:hypothetical protein
VSLDISNSSVRKHFLHLDSASIVEEIYVERSLKVEGVFDVESALMRVAVDGEL